MKVTTIVFTLVIAAFAFTGQTTEGLLAMIVWLQLNGLEQGKQPISKETDNLPAGDIKPSI